MRHFRILLCTFSVLIYLNIDAKIVDRQPEGEIPFHLAEDNRIYVTAFVNGSDSLNFLVDTGASSLVLNTNSPKLQGHIFIKERRSIILVRPVRTLWNIATTIP